MKQINLQENLRKKFKKKGVKMIAPNTVFFSNDTKIGKNVVIEPYVVIGKKVELKNKITILSFSHLENVKIENNVTVGPFARLRPGTVLKSGSRIGNFVEVKKSTIGKNSKVNHLSYIGDAHLGKNVNIGSNSSLVAPVTVNENSVVGAGSVITKNVRKKSLALTRSKQVEIKNYKRKK